MGPEEGIGPINELSSGSVFFSGEGEVRDLVRPADYRAHWQAHKTNTVFITSCKPTANDVYQRFVIIEYVNDVVRIVPSMPQKQSNESARLFREGLRRVAICEKSLAELALGPHVGLVIITGNQWRSWEKYCAIPDSRISGRFQLPRLLSVMVIFGKSNTKDLALFNSRLTKHSLQCRMSEK
jgi:hypothetical protein